MKKFFCLLLFLLFVPFQSIGEEQQQCVVSYDYWMCYQVGSIDKEVVLVVSDVVYLLQSSCSKKLNEKFINLVKKETEDRFVPTFSLTCEDYESQKEAKKDLKKKIEIAKKRKLRIFRIKFSE